MNAQTVSKPKRKPTGAAANGPGPGRPKGCPNKTTTVLKDAILQAATNVGGNGRGGDGLVGYLESVARNDPKAFTPLLGKVLPLQVTGGGVNGAHEIVLQVVGVATNRAT